MGSENLIHLVLTISRTRHGPRPETRVGDGTSCLSGTLGLDGTVRVGPTPLENNLYLLKGLIFVVCSGVRSAFVLVRH